MNIRDQVSLYAEHELTKFSLDPASLVWLMLESGAVGESVGDKWALGAKLLDSVKACSFWKPLRHVCTISCVFVMLPYPCLKFFNYFHFRIFRKKKTTTIHNLPVHMTLLRLLLL